MISRRTAIAGLFSAFAAPAIVRVESIMPVKATPALILAANDVGHTHTIGPPLPPHSHGPWPSGAHTHGISY